MANATFTFPEALNFGGKRLRLIYDPGNPQRAQALPNFGLMVPLPTSATQEVELPGLGKKWLAIIDAKSPAQPMQPGGRPSVEMTYLCFRLLDANLSPMLIEPSELVVYAEEPPKAREDNEATRAQRLIDTVLGVVMESAPVPSVNWTEQLALVQAQQAGAGRGGVPSSAPAPAHGASAPSGGPEEDAEEGYDA